VDPATIEAAYYLGDLQIVSPAEALTSSNPGDFVVYNKPSATDHLVLTYIRADGTTADAAIECVGTPNPTRVRLAGSAPDAKAYRTVSQLVAALCDPLSAVLDGPLSMPPLHHVHGEPWMHAQTTHDQASYLLLGQPEGTFIVRVGVHNGGPVPTISYYSRGNVFHVNVIRDDGDKPPTCHLVGSAHRFGSLRALIDAYTEDAGGDLRTKLVMSSDPHLRGGLVYRPRWLRLGIPKVEALEEISLLLDGSFVIRSAGSDRSGLVLSYTHNFSIFTDPIIQHKTPGRVTMYSLATVRDARFPSLTAMVQHFRSPGRGLKCPLALQLVAEVGRRPSATTPRRRHTVDTAEAPTTLKDIRTSQRDQTLHGKSHPPPPPGAARWYCLHLSKAEALGRLPKGLNGAFVFRPSAQHYATLSIVVSGRIFNAHVLKNTGGFRLKGSFTDHSSLAALVAHYSDEGQTGLPIALAKW